MVSGEPVGEQRAFRVLIITTLLLIGMLSASTLVLLVQIHSAAYLDDYTTVVYLIVVLSNLTVSNLNFVANNLSVISPVLAGQEC